MKTRKRTEEREYLFAVTSSGINLRKRINSAGWNEDTLEQTSSKTVIPSAMLKRVLTRQAWRCVTTGFGPET